MFTEHLLFIGFFAKPFVYMIPFNPYNNLMRKKVWILLQFSRWANPEVVGKDHLWGPCRPWCSQFLKWPPILSFLHIFIHPSGAYQVSGISQRGFSQQIEGWIRFCPPMSEEKKARVHFIPCCLPQWLSIHPSLHSLTNSKIKHLLCSGSLLRYWAQKEHHEENEECLSRCPFLLES